MSTFVPKFHVSFANMHCENAEFIPCESFLDKENADLLNSINVNLFFRVGFVQQGDLQLTLSPIQAEQLALELVKRLNWLGSSQFAESPNSQPAIQDIPRKTTKAFLCCNCQTITVIRLDVDPVATCSNCEHHMCLHCKSGYFTYLSQIPLSSKPPSRTALKDALNPSPEDLKEDA